MDELQKKYRKNESFVYRRIQHEKILIPVKDNVGDMDSLYNLNEVGAFIWERLDGEKTLRDIRTMITEAFEVSSEEAQEDLYEFVRQLKEIDAILEVRNL
jgi:hypothetical protein